MLRDGKTVGHSRNIVSDPAEPCLFPIAPLPTGGQAVGIVSKTLRKVSDDALGLDPNWAKGVMVIEVGIKVAFDCPLLRRHHRRKPYQLPAAAPNVVQRFNSGVLDPPPRFRQYIAHHGADAIAH